MFFKKKEEEFFSELRKDAVSGEWILVTAGRAKRPQEFAPPKREPAQLIASCPFEDARMNGFDPLLWYPHPKSLKKDQLEEWFLQVILNKYPAVMPHEDRTCAVAGEDGPYERIDGVGYHEVVITRPHERSLGEMTAEEAALVMRSYRERYAALKKDPCISYILVFHNHGREAGASISHPHSQIIALPIIPPDVQRSVHGSMVFYEAHAACIHCRMISWELEDGRRIVYENKDFLVIAPYASRISFELRMYPKEHDPYFDLLSEKKLESSADALTAALRKLGTALNDPPYNFFIHTAPTSSAMEHYHWHIEILPKTSVPAGLELGAGVDVTVVKPEDVPGLLAA
ncbi:MAG: UDPglucose--hexose-1-phosphate uridylyltransferase [Parcubacteria group bacterium Gr01-1014_70]|nr:MAG: UDPglucose--hexose-1-phosphate uridylyltransferase [Parcubacteria group bacterium Gr01-1014_70]